jgi:hypothetical protein
MPQRKKLAAKLGRSYEYKLFCSNPKSVKLPLPVSVFCYRITRTTFGFLSAIDRAQATIELRKFAVDKGFDHLHVTYYRDTNGPFASQIFLIRKASELVKQMTLKEYREAMARPKEICYNIGHEGTVRRSDGKKDHDVQTGKVIA